MVVSEDKKIVGAKVQEFEQQALELVAGRPKALVFSQSTDFLKLLAERLIGAGISYQYLDGSTPTAERCKRVVGFQRDVGDLFLISLKAGGFGLNLTAADYVLIVDPWWNPAAEDQAMGRADRGERVGGLAARGLKSDVCCSAQRVPKVFDDRAAAGGKFTDGH